MVGQEELAAFWWKIGSNMILCYLTHHTQEHGYILKMKKEYLYNWFTLIFYGSHDIVMAKCFQNQYSGMFFWKILVT